MQPGGGFQLAKPRHSEHQTDEGIKIAITARTSREARVMLEGLKRKYPSVDIDAALNTAEESYTYPEGVVRKVSGSAASIPADQ